MQHMNSVRVPATVIFSALLVIIMVSASRTTYTFATASREASVLGPCTLPAAVRSPDPAYACPWPQAPRVSQKWPRKVNARGEARPDNPDSGVDAAAPADVLTGDALTEDALADSVPADDPPAQAMRAGDRTE